MIVTLASGTVALAEGTDFTAFSVDAAGLSSTDGNDALGKAHAGWVDGKHAFITISFLQLAAGEARHDPAWNVGFQKMIAFARSKDWLSPDEQSIRAHILNLERHDPS